MNLEIWIPYALCGSALIGLGLYGLLVNARLLRRILAFNVIGSGIFLLFGAMARRSGAPYADPVPQAMIITGIVVAIAATALALGLIVAHARAGGGEGLPGDDAMAEVQDDEGLDGMSDGVSDDVSDERPEAQESQR